MNYTEVTNLALQYADREDTEVTSRIDDFLRIVESRINRQLRVGDMTVRAQLATDSTKNYYGLPTDFQSLRDVQINVGSDVKTCQFATPELMNGLNNETNLAHIYYSIINNQLHILPTLEDGNFIEIVYYKRIDPLTAVADENWISTNYPDCYVFGLLVEINSFIKDAEAVILWEERFKSSISEIAVEDNIDRWSGNALETRLG